MRHDQLRIRLLQHPRQQCEMIVLHENEGWLLAGLFYGRFRKKLV